MTEDLALAALTPLQTRLLLAGVSIRDDPPEQIDFLHSIQCQIGLPYNNPGNEVRKWTRRQGGATLQIEAGSAIDPRSGEFVELGLPYGEKPRLVLIHLASEAVRTGSPVVQVEESMTAFARALGIDANGRQLRGLKDQLARLAAASMRLGFVEGQRAVQVNSQFVSAFDVWFPVDPTQKTLWPSTLRLSDDFFSSLKRHAVPLDHRAIAALSSSSMALDVYVWLAQRLFRIPGRKPQFLTWPGLHEQFGQGFNRLRDFRRQFLHTLQQVRTVYPNAQIDADERGVTLHQSRPPVLPRSERLTLVSK